MSGLNELNDNQLYQRLADDDQRAFELLYERYWKQMVYKAFCKLDSSKDAEELVQDTFIDIWKSRKRIVLKHSFHTFIAAIVRYKIIAKIAARNKSPRDFVDISQIQVTEDSTERLLYLRDLNAEIELAVKALPEKCQMVFRMSREEGKSDKQIAAELYISQKTVEAHLHKALKILRRALGKLHFLLLLVYLICIIKK
ncbi:RNA polymerase sigma-70 factor, ECF subfamily [Chitinophaga ginsengisegetis]|uniref:RNA polymerase sigma factor n=1 Tax=Chitinophaga ginsengisegetis TaxID=393003 RepID=A0A1T5NJS4_9BACT|nr:RNA polymerase sigma-70 factor [Chitinophaga ginsengisegetis]SKD00860.1 RNA polymerase sigma-70 factor, ECF subfamily [Chitinophaga ginsengisegetis]